MTRTSGKPAQGGQGGMSGNNAQRGIPAPEAPAVTIRRAAAESALAIARAYLDEQEETRS